MKLGEMYPSNYLKADVDVPEEGDLVATIKGIEMEELGQVGSKELKPVVYFKGIDKGLVLNKTNATTISKLYGDDTDEWEGKRIALYSTDVEFQGKVGRGIRVKSKAPKPAPPKTAPTAEEMEEAESIPF